MFLANLNFLYQSNSRWANTGHGREIILISVNLGKKGCNLKQNSYKDYTCHKNRYCLEKWQILDVLKAMWHLLCFIDLAAPCFDIIINECLRLENATVQDLHRPTEKQLLNGFLFLIFHCLSSRARDRQKVNFTTISNQNNFQQALIYRIEFP